MESEWNKKPMKMRVEYVDGGESSIASLNSSGADSSREDVSQDSLPECYEPRIIPPYDLILNRPKNLGSPPSRSSSSASAATSSGELFQIIPPEVIKSTGKILYSFTKDKEEIVSRLEMAPASPTLSDNIQCDELMVLGKSPTQSPPIQVMDRASVASSHNPYRIPAAVFATTSTAPVDWSNASNDSLFSIRIGNASNVWRPDTVKPKRELTLTPDRRLSPPPCEKGGDETADKSTPEGKNKFGGFMTIVEKETDDYPIKEQRATQAAMLDLSSELDDGGGVSKPYSFPMKKKTGGRKSSRSRWCLRIFPCLAWPSWCYSNCCRPLCCCKTSCCSKWRCPSCSCCSSCSLAFCFCKCIRPWRCFSDISNWAICYVCSCRAKRKLTGPDPNSRDQILVPQDNKVSSCFSCGSCCSCFSGGYSCCSCKACTSCFSCGSCYCFSCSCSYSCCSRRWWRCSRCCCC